jgi:hypothetical protein
MKRLLLAGMLVAALMAPATASAAPTGEFAKFAKCPYTNPVIFACVYAETTSGTFTIGNKTVPIKNPVILQGGVETVIPETLVGPLKFYGATDGNTLSKTPQPVPGGLLGVTAPTWWPSILRDLFNETINNGFTGVTATVELAAPASSIELSLANIITQQGTALGLPVKVKLSNPFLGSNCYIGSNSNPIKLNLTAGTTSPPPPNQPIAGSTGLPELLQEGLLAVTNNRLVDNAFAAPGANGCGGILFSWAVDPFVNSIVGVPSPAGTNTAILEGTTYLGEAAYLRTIQ